MTHTPGHKTYIQTKAEKPDATTQSATGEDAGPKPLGVPRDYAAPGVGTVSGPRWNVFGSNTPGSRVPAPPVAPRYMDGAQWAPASMSPANVARLQEKLVNAGLLGEYRKGFWDAASLKAYTSVLEFANASGLDERQALDQIGSAPLENMDPAAARQPLVARQSNPLDIKRGADKVAKAVLGRRLSEKELPAIIQAIQALEVGAQQQAYDAAGGAGGVVTEAPQIESLVEEKVRAADPHAAQEMDLLSMNNTIMGFLKGGGDG